MSAQDDQKLANDATVAIITALPKEQAAMKAMLDGPIAYSTAGNAPGEYFLGTIPSKDGERHVVVLACSSMGGNLASAHASILFERFPRIRHVVMVGIAGAVPDPSKEETDIRLGDIITSSCEGVIQYDHDKEVVRNGKVKKLPRHPPRPPSPRLLQASSELLVLELEGKQPWRRFLERGNSLPWTRRPTEEDVLYEAVDPSRPIPRVERDPANLTRVFHGPIGSANKLLKNAKLRERLRKTFSIKAVEMEASGVADASWLQENIGYFVVRGTCDYCDGHKGDAWQGYAALVAAAYTRALLEQTRSKPQPQEGPGAHPSTNSPMASGMIDALPRGLREKCEHLKNRDSALAALLEELLAADAKTVSRFDGSWPFRDTWTSLVVRALNETVVDEIILGNDEIFVAIAVVALISSSRKAWIAKKFNADGTPWDEWFRELSAANPSLSLLGDEKKLSDSAFELLGQSAVLRVAANQRPSWADSWFRDHRPDTPLARSLANDPRITALIRAVGGSANDFQALADTADFRFERDTFEVRWRLLACVLSLAEFRVLGLHLLSHEVLENVAQLPDVAEAVKRQFRDDVTIIADKDSNWILRATCDEPVLDHALRQIAESLTKELRERRAGMSDYMMRTLQRGFPSISTDIQPRLHDGRPRYTIPHVKFALSAEHARRIFMGSDLWGDDSLAYRELFQNALDACRYRVARSKYLGIPYTPLIQLFHGRNQNGEEFVECVDNGIGMTRELVSSCFATAGSRFVDTTEFRREREQWREKGIEVYTNSQFGIGVFSYFLVADELEVETARLGADGELPKERLQLRIPTASSFFRIVTLTPAEALAGLRARAEERGQAVLGGLDAGTRVRLKLRQRRSAKATIEEAPRTCVDAIRQHVWISEFRTEVHDYRGGELILEPNQLSPMAWLKDAVQASVEAPPFWWLPISEIPFRYKDGQAAETFRSRKSNKANDSFGYYSFGRVLVDGIATDMTTPGFIVNLRGELTPRLSLDRSKIRSDIREVLENAVGKALPSLPEEVSEQFMEDIWNWDPRACHRVGESTRRHRVLIKLGPPLSPRAVTVSRLARRYLPALPYKKPYVGRKKDGWELLLSLWRLAKDMPDAREQSAFVLEARGVDSSLPHRLNHVPKPVWDALQHVELGVPDAAALNYGMETSQMSVVSAYVSWLTGDTVASCHQRLEKLSRFLGLPWSSSEIVTNTVISDYDAWLLGGGQLTTPWAGPTIRTLDILRFCDKTGHPLPDSVDEFRELVARLGWTLDFDPGLAQRGMDLTRSEFIEVDMLRKGFDPSTSLSPARLELLAQLAGVPTPLNLEHPTPETKDLLEEEKAVVAALSSTSRQKGLGLARACSVARTLDRPLSVALELVVRAAQILGVCCDWTQDEQEMALRLSANDWDLVEDMQIFSIRKSLFPKDARSLAASLSSKSYSYGRLGDEHQIHARLTELYTLFRWGALPLSTAGVKSALTLTYRQSQLLQTAPASGRYSIPRAIVAALELDADVQAIDADLKTLSLFGICGPAPQDEYLDVRWHLALASCVMNGSEAPENASS